MFETVSLFSRLMKKTAMKRTFVASPACHRTILRTAHHRCLHYPYPNHRRRRRRRRRRNIPTLLEAHSTLTPSLMRLHLQIVARFSSPLLTLLRFLFYVETARASLQARLKPPPLVSQIATRALWSVRCDPLHYPS